MAHLRVYSAAEQVARYLKEELEKGTWAGEMPGGALLTRELGVGRMTVDAALDLLEKEGFLKSQGARKRRLIASPGRPAPPVMRVAILLYEPEDAANRHIFALRERLQSAGHRFAIAPKTLVDLNHDPKRVAAMVKDFPAETWIVLAGSKPVLEWFAQASVPAFALFGRMQGLPIAGTGPDKVPALKEALRVLTHLGHRRIVMLVREERRKPFYGRLEKAFLDELELRGMKTGPYNIPDWEESVGGLRKCLDTLFQVTPPSAIMVGDSMLFLAVKNYLSQPGIQKSEKIALICTDDHPSFKWCKPAVAHIHWDHRSAIRRIMRWIDNLALGKHDLRQSLTPTQFIEGNLRLMSADRR